MSFMGTVGSVAQAAQGAITTAPTGVSIALDSSTGQDNAVVIEMNSGVVFFGDGGTSFSSGGDFSSTHNSSGQGSDMASAYDGNAVQEIFIFQAYCRATGATSFTWDVSIDSNSSVNGSTSVIGTAVTTQGGTAAGTGIGEKVQWDFAGGKSGVQYPENGMELIIKINCTATNAHGSTDADELTVTYVFT